ncbi:hypothetical protein [Acidisoma sp. 7E03]
MVRNLVHVSSTNRHIHAQVGRSVMHHACDAAIPLPRFMAAVHKSGMPELQWRRSHAAECEARGGRKRIFETVMSSSYGLQSERHMNTFFGMRKKQA